MQSLPLPYSLSYVLYHSRFINKRVLPQCTTNRIRYSLDVVHPFYVNQLVLLGFDEICALPVFLISCLRLVGEIMIGIKLDLVYLC